MTLISVLLAAFASPYLAEAVDSVRGQTSSDWELLVLDDANSAITRRNMNELGDPRVRYIANKTRLGPAINHRQGVDLARSDLIAIINHDDRWEPHLLETLGSAIASQPQAVVSFSDHYVITGDGVVDPDLTKHSGERWGRADLAGGLHIPFQHLAIVKRAIPIAQCAVWRKSAIPRIPTWAGDRYDYWIQIALSLTGRGAVYVPERLASFRVHGQNLGASADLRRRIEGFAFYSSLLRSCDLGMYASPVRAEKSAALRYLAKWPAWLIFKKGLSS